MAKTSSPNCVIYALITSPQQSIPLEQESNHNNAVQLPPTPTASDDEEERVLPKLLKDKTIKIQKRETLSLMDLIPVASASMRAKHRASTAAQPTQDSALARALTKVKIGVQTLRLKERYLLNEWIRLALATPIDESAINNSAKKRALQTNRTIEIVRWYEHKFKLATLSLEEIEHRVDSLRRQKLLAQQQEETFHSMFSLLPPFKNSISLK